jgi:hypothetical protein
VLNGRSQRSQYSSATRPTLRRTQVSGAVSTFFVNFWFAGAQSSVLSG